MMAVLMPTSFGLDEGFDLEFAGGVGHRTALGADDAGRDGGTQVLGQRGTDRKDPLAEAQLVAVAELDDREVLRVDLDQRDVRGRVGPDDRRLVNLVVIEGYADFRRILDDVVVRHDIAVRADDDAGAAPLLLTGLRLAVLVAEEETEERVDLLVLLPRTDRHFDIDDSLDGVLRRIGEVGIIAFCQIDSPVLDRAAMFTGRVVHETAGIRGLDHAIGRQSAQQDGQKDHKKTSFHNTRSLICSKQNGRHRSTAAGRGQNFQNICQLHGKNPYICAL